MKKQTSKFKETEIGIIPEDWEELKLSEAIGVNPKRELKKGVSAKKVPMDRLSPFNKKIKSFEVSKFSGGSKFINGDTLMARITPCLENGKTAFVDILSDDEVGFGSTEFIVLSGKNGKTTNDFVYYLSISPQLRKEAIKSMTGTSGRQRVQNDLFEEIELIIPPLPEQSAIAKILSDLDSKIELNQQMNKTLEAIGQAIFKHWFIDFEFPNEKGKPYKSSGGEMVDSELGEIPKGWIFGEFLDVLKKIESGSRPKGGIDSNETEIPSIGAENIDGIANHDYSKEKYISREFFEKMKQGIVKNNDVLMYKDGAKIGRISFFDYEYPHKKCAINEHVFILRTNGKINQEFLYLWLDRSNMTQSIINLNSNAAQPGINQTQVKTLPILIPNKEILNKFQFIIKILFHKIFENAKQNQNLSQIRDLLLPRLMSGRIRVPVEARI